MLHTEADARRVARVELGRRAALTGRLIGGALVTSAGQQQARQSFAGPRAGLARVISSYMRDRQVSRVVVLDAHGGLLASSDLHGRSASGLLARHPELRAAVDGRAAVSDVFEWPAGKPAFEIALPFDSPTGRRVLGIAAPVQLIRSFADGFLSGASAVRRTQAYLLDGHGRLLAASDSSAAAPSIADRALTAAMRERSHGSYGDRTFTAMPVPHTGWRVVFSVPSSQLYASVERSRQAVRALFAAFSVTLLVLVGLAFAALRSAGRLNVLREREAAARVLAHERLHDPLTRLPNRALFLDRLEHALAALPRGKGVVAVLFIDVDSFKSINDSLGHGLGDAVLRQIAERLQSVMRAGDTISRFGGDEFLMLSADTTGDRAAAVRWATRVRDAFEAPLLVEGHELAVGLSVGVSVRGASEQPVEAGDLVREADLAMYRAKHRGGACVELFDVELDRATSTGPSLEGDH
jgi:diguanylate cyclase (GGDEF)-like protein